MIYCNIVTILDADPFSSLKQSQYTYPLDFIPIYDIAKEEIIHIDVPQKRIPLNKAPSINYGVVLVQSNDDFCNELKPLEIIQPEGPSFHVDGNVVHWQNWNLHVGFNHREGIVLSNITYNDKGNVRPVSKFLSIAANNVINTISGVGVLAYLARGNGCPLWQSRASASAKTRI